MENGTLNDSVIEPFSLQSSIRPVGLASIGALRKVCSMDNVHEMQVLIVKLNR